jgi:hypothetical protein
MSAASSSTGPGPSSNATVTATAGATAPATAAASVGPTDGNVTTGKPKAAGPNITIAPAGDMAAGPMSITPVYCGPLSAAQQAQFKTTATGGLIYRYANHSGEAAAAKLYVAFIDGSAVAGENYAGTPPEIASGHSAEGEVDALGISGQGVKFTSCEIESYALQASSGVDPVSYAGLRSGHARDP